MADYKYMMYETIDDGKIARLSMNRPEARNAQNRGLLVELGETFLRAEADDAVRVVILRGLGPVFTAGHDLGTAAAQAERSPGPDQHYTTKGYGATLKGTEKRFLQEWHFFLENTRRWRDLRKITIAQVQGSCYAAGLMLAWCCDLIVAAEGTQFADVVGTRLGMCGVEYFAHPWEFGARKTKELMLTGDSISADEAHQLGMVSKVFPTDKMEDETLSFARRIARLPTMTTMLIKESVNQTMDNQGFYNSIKSCFSLHQLNHAHWAEVTKGERAAAPEEEGIPNWKQAPPVKPAVKGLVEAGVS